MNEKDMETRGLYILLIVAAERIVTKIVRYLSKRDPANRFLTNIILLHILVIVVILLISVILQKIK